MQRQRQLLCFAAPAVHLWRGRATPGAVHTLLRRPQPSRSPHLVADSMGLAVASAQQQQRFQSSAVSDKKYHCSICNKGFRLEMAARVHLQQAHQGQGNILAGAGADADADAPDTSTSSRPPSGPTIPTEAPPQSSALSGRASPPFSPYRKPRPTPKPLNEPENDLTDAVMKALLGVWDDIGVSRLGESFLHSSMIVKVAAAAPHVVGPTSATTATGTSTIASPTTSTSTTSGHLRDGTATGEEAPAYGQVPMYGQPLPGAAATSPFSRSTVASPFSTVAASPFAAAVNSPFVQPASPFVDSATTEVARGVSSPFTPITTGPSPFVTAEMMTGAAHGTDLNPFGGFPTSPVFAGDTSSVTGAHSIAAAPAPETTLQVPCATCGNVFSSHDGMRMHAKAKHGVDVPRETTRNNGARRGRRGGSGGVPDLPPYVPSPVDMDMTVPFGSVQAESRWDETVLRLHSASVNSILLVGSVTEVLHLTESTSQMSMTTDETAETFVVRCAPALLADVDVGCRVCVQGSLRMKAIADSESGRPLYTPLIVVSPSSGVIASIPTK